MGRAPCCEKMGLKKGPWTAGEDHILVSYIRKHGHGNWRALPKQAGLLRCGKSCRLRWTNYLRPDIKRGNFTKEEEDTIISLHELMGNRWSAIAARLPGRTDNEIKNVWHTHLKKRVKPKPTPAHDPNKEVAAGRGPAAAEMDSKIATFHTSPPATAAEAAATSPRYEEPTRLAPLSPPQSCSEVSTTTTADSSALTRSEAHDAAHPLENLLGMDDSFWSEALSLDSSVTSMDWFMETSSIHAGGSQTNASSNEDDMDFWLRMLREAGELPELPSF